MLVDQKKWGKGRLNSLEQWPGTNRPERQDLANQVVDLFHRKVQVQRKETKSGVDVQWKPGAGELKPLGHTTDEDINLSFFEKLLEECYASVRDQY